MPRGGYRCPRWVEQRPGWRSCGHGVRAVDRAKTGSKHHILTCANGFPLAVTLSAANVNDHLLLPELLDRVRPLRGRSGPPRHRIKTLIADGWDPLIGSIGCESSDAPEWVQEETITPCHDVGIPLSRSFASCVRASGCSVSSSVLRMCVSTLRSPRRPGIAGRTSTAA